MASLDFASALGSIIPRVEDPLPDSLGLGFPFTVAGAFGVLADVIFAEASQEKREQAINRAGVLGFRAGTAIYLLALSAQVASAI